MAEEKQLIVIQRSIWEKIGQQTKWNRTEYVAKENLIQFLIESMETSEQFSEFFSFDNVWVDVSYGGYYDEERGQIAPSQKTEEISFTRVSGKAHDFSRGMKAIQLSK